MQNFFTYILLLLQFLINFDTNSVQVIQGDCIFALSESNIKLELLKKYSEIIHTNWVKF